MYQNTAKIILTKIDLPDGLKKEAVLRLVLKMIGDLENSESWQEFEKRNKQPLRESIDFDNLIQRILNRPPQ